jgi:hypothetical protein
MKCHVYFYAMFRLRENACQNCSSDSQVAVLRGRLEAARAARAAHVAAGGDPDTQTQVRGCCLNKADLREAIVNIELWMQCAW